MTEQESNPPVEDGPAKDGIRVILAGEAYVYTTVAIEKFYASSPFFVGIDFGADPLNFVVLEELEPRTFRGSNLMIIRNDLADDFKHALESYRLTEKPREGVGLKWKEQARLQEMKEHPRGRKRRR